MQEAHGGSEEERMDSAPTVPVSLTSQQDGEKPEALGQLPAQH